MDVLTIKEIDDLIKLGIGDSQRLSYIKGMLLQERDLYNSDKKYLEKLNLIRDTKLDPSTSTNNINEHQPSSNVQTTDKDESQSTPVDDVTTPKEKVIIKYVYKSSAAWYLLPLCLWILGGIISYACLRKRDPGRARNTLILGSVLSILPIIILVGFVTYFADEYSVSTTNMSLEEIKQASLLVPYNSLIDDSDTYVGEVVRYDGKIVQAMEQFDIYVLRISTSFDGFASDDVIWVNYEPKTDEERQWLEKLEQDLVPFTGPNSDNLVRVWGESKGLTDYSNIFGGTVTLPKIDGWIIERLLLDEDVP